MPCRLHLKFDSCVCETEALPGCLELACGRKGLGGSASLQGTQTGEKLQPHNYFCFIGNK